jgi:hypothetical protein
VFGRRRCKRRLNWLYSMQVKQRETGANLIKKMRQNETSSDKTAHPHGMDFGGINQTNST